MLLLPDTPDRVGEILPASVDDAGGEYDDTSADPNEQGDGHDSVEYVLRLELHIGVCTSTGNDDVAHVVDDQHQHGYINEIEHATVEDQTSSHEVMQSVLVELLFFLSAQEHQLDEREHVASELNEVVQ